MEWGAPHNFIWLWTPVGAVCLFFLASLRKRSELSRFGELALVDNAPRSADIVARGFGHLLTVDRDAFREFCLREPALGNLLMWKLVATLGQRLRSMNDQLRAR